MILAVLLAACGASTPLEVGTEEDGKKHHHDDKHHDTDTDAEGPSCDEICDRWRDCGLDDADTCEVDCPPLRSGVSPEAWQTMFGECLEETCPYVEACVEDSKAEVEAQEYHFAFCEDACARKEDCGDGDPDCVDAACGRGEGDFNVRLLSEKVIAELTACLSRDCGDPMERCAEEILEKHGLDGL